MYKVTLKLGTDIYKAEGDDFLKAIQKLKPVKITTYGLFTIKKKGAKTVEKLLKPVHLRRLLGNDVAKQVFAKQVKEGLIASM